MALSNESEFFHFVSRIFCVKVKLLHTFKKELFSGLKLTNLGEFLSPRQDNLKISHHILPNPKNPKDDLLRLA
jgi:hypothetical protein